jgi:hypothetical protein
MFKNFLVPLQFVIAGAPQTLFSGLGTSGDNINFDSI